MQLDPEQADGIAVIQAAVRRVAWVAGGGDGEPAWIGRVQKSRLAGKDGGPGIAAGVDRAGQDEGQLRIELAMLIDHMIADHAAVRRHLLGNAGAALNRNFADVPGRALDLVRSIRHDPFPSATYAASPTGGWCASSTRLKVTISAVMG